MRKITLIIVLLLLVGCGAKKRVRTNESISIEAKEYKNTEVKEITERVLMRLMRNYRAKIEEKNDSIIKDSTGVEKKYNNKIIIDLEKKEDLIKENVRDSVYTVLQEQKEDLQDRVSRSDDLEKEGISEFLLFSVFITCIIILFASFKK